MNILDETWKLMIIMSSSETEYYNIFYDILLEIGNTCIQGDSHRLLNLWEIIQL